MHLPVNYSPKNPIVRTKADEKPKIKKNRIDWNTGKLTHSNNYEPLEKKWIIDSSSRKVDSVFLTK